MMHVYPSALRALKAELGLTTGQLARRLDRSPTTVRRWLAGARPIPGDVLERLAVDGPLVMVLPMHDDASGP